MVLAPAPQFEGAGFFFEVSMAQKTSTAHKLERQKTLKQELTLSRLSPEERELIKRADLYEGGRIITPPDSRALVSAVHKISDKGLAYIEMELSDKGKRITYYKLTPQGRKLRASKNPKHKAKINPRHMKKFEDWVRANEPFYDANKDKLVKFKLLPIQEQRRYQKEWHQQRYESGEVDPKKTWVRLPEKDRDILRRAEQLTVEYREKDGAYGRKNSHLVEMGLLERSSYEGEDWFVSLTDFGNATLAAGRKNPKHKTKKKTSKKNPMLTTGKTVQGWKIAEYIPSNIHGDQQIKLVRGSRGIFVTGRPYEYWGVTKYDIKTSAPIERTVFTAPNRNEAIKKAIKWTEQTINPKRKTKKKTKRASPTKRNPKCEIGETMKPKSNPVIKRGRIIEGWRIDRYSPKDKYIGLVKGNITIIIQPKERAFSTPEFRGKPNEWYVNLYHYPSLNYITTMEERLISETEEGAVKKAISWAERQPYARNPKRKAKKKAAKKKTTKKKAKRASPTKHNPTIARGDIIRDWIVEDYEPGNYAEFFKDDKKLVLTRIHHRGRYNYYAELWMRIGYSIIGSKKLYAKNFDDAVGSAMSWANQQKNPKRKAKKKTTRKRNPQLDPRTKEALTYINRKRARLGERQLDPVVARWEPEDIVAEAQRLGWRPKPEPISHVKVGSIISGWKVTYYKPQTRIILIKDKKILTVFPNIEDPKRKWDASIHKHEIKPENFIAAKTGFHEKSITEATQTAIIWANQQKNPKRKTKKKTNKKKYTHTFKERIPGGLAAGKKPSDFDKRQLKKGTKVELEHTSAGKKPSTKDLEIAREIAMDHLMEDPLYYEKLAKIEKHKSKKKTSKKKSGKKKTTKRRPRKKNPSLIKKCRASWDHYCERPNKTRLKAVFKCLEEMKGSKVKTVQSERRSCLRTAKAEAKRLKLSIS